MKEVTIVCDGSSLGNGKEKPRAAAVAVLGYRGYWRAFGEYLGEATNQQAEWWKKLDSAAQKHEIRWEWTKGHAGHEVQEVADKMARKAAELGRIDEKLLEDAVSEIGITEI